MLMAMIDEKNLVGGAGRKWSMRLLSLVGWMACLSRSSRVGCLWRAQGCCWHCSRRAWSVGCGPAD